MQTTYKGILKQALVERSRANPGYSLRAFARDLGLAPSTLSEVLNGRKGLSPRKSDRVAKGLRLPEWQSSYFRDLVARSHARSLSEKKEASERLAARAEETALQHLKSETARSLTSWLDLAVLEATHLKDFQPSETWLAKKLGVGASEVRAVKQRLVQVKLLEVSPDGSSWRDLSPFFSTSDGIPSEAIRAYHRSVLRLAEQKLERDPLEDRVMKSVVFSLEDSQVAEARRILDDAIAAVMSLASRGDGPKDHVVCFASQLLTLAKGEKTTDAKGEKTTDAKGEKTTDAKGEAAESSDEKGAGHA